MPRFTIESLVPEVYARYRSAVRDAFRFLLDRLPADYAATLPTDVHDRGLRLPEWVEFFRQSPTLHKLAQVIGRNRHLAAELRSALRSLETFAPRIDPQAILHTLRSELGRDAGDLIIDEPPLAEASVAVVIPFTLPSGPGISPMSPRTQHQRHANEPPVRGVLKVLKPGIRQRLETELAVWSDLGGFFNERCTAYGLPDVDYRETFDTVAELLRNEVDLTGEQRHLASAAEQLRLPGVIVPRLLPYCTPNVTAMERIDGITLTALADADRLHTVQLSVQVRERLARALVEAVLAAPFWSMSPQSMFHADPHGGNLLATPHGQLGLLDWALVGFLTDNDREQLAQIVLRAALFDASGVCMAIDRLCRSTLARPASLRRAIDSILARYRSDLAPSLDFITALLDAAATEGGARLPKHLLLYRKSLMTVEGVVTDLAGEDFTDRALRESATAQLLREWPARCLLPPFSRAVGTRLSSLDLWSAGIQLPAATLQRLSSAANQCRDRHEAVAGRSEPRS